ncbi:exodeoxyribonuclease VII large subunit [Oxalobacter sp. OxGP1]|uniref:exodeoxyribonuclease VII large subunit n=1 Tax=Oxalobacter paeniformigenes TaxID=2946594 RepID=UPI0022AF25FD|nr:exodeoxyribonuclease VII large subunit [Oxalobacter paeniformigenes]MCZ4053441.1 exodeoxyribonuclease VII large subunit [Oxalobacter paeniformigenes]
MPSSRIASSSPVLSVTELNGIVANLLTQSIPLLWISGEISNFTRAASGHWYFTLKDDKAQVRVVMFRNRAQLANFIPRNGDHVEVRATVSLYTPRGDFQLNAEAIRHAGAGSLYEAFLRLKAKLEAEGLFEQSRKRPLPLLARTIGIVTSPKAAALRDILTTLYRRAPHISVILYPAAVQGADAPAAIVQAIETASERAECDVLLICRGGGSIEDLWSFNNENVARAIANCTIPTISGIGHETDFTIADFVSDLRAPTPTGAAELAARARDDWMEWLSTQAGKLKYAMKRRLEKTMQETDSFSRRLISPSTYITSERLKSQTLATRLAHTGTNTLAAWRHELANMRTRLKAQLPDTVPLHTRLSHLQDLLARTMAAQLTNHRKNIQSLSAQLELLSPQRTLERGYAIMTDTEGQIIRSPEQLPIHAPVSVRLASGTAQIRIESVQDAIE